MRTDRSHTERQTPLKAAHTSKATVKQHPTTSNVLQSIPHCQTKEQQVFLQPCLFFFIAIVRGVYILTGLNGISLDT